MNALALSDFRLQAHKAIKGGIAYLRWLLASPRQPQLHIGRLQPSLAVEIVNEHRYHCDMIQSFRCVDTQALFDGKRVARFANFEAVALRKLQQLNAAAKLEFLRVPPGNQLEALKRDRKGQHSIRINSQWRVCFVWNDGHANSVEIVDYH